MSNNFTGNATHSIRSINVRANVLTEWTANQSRYRSEVLKYTGGIALCVVASLILLPVFEKVRAKAVAQQMICEVKLNRLSQDLASAQAAKAAAAPKTAAADLRAQTSGYFTRMLGEFYQVLDSAKSGMAFSTAKIDIRGAEVIIDCHGDAENYEIAAAFADQSGSTPSKVSTLASTRPNGLLGPAGIAFEYFKRVSLQ